jgi:glycine reductase
MDQIRVVHYLNQFFAGVGGEKHAATPPALRPVPVGPGVPLDAALRPLGAIVATVYCGDDHLHSAGDEVIDRIVGLVKDAQPVAFVAGPAFASGRYGVACGAVARAVQTRLGIPAIAAMAPDNPAVPLYRRDVIIVPSGASPTSMRELLPTLARLILKCGRGEALGPPDEEGYLPRGTRRNVLVDRTAAHRAVDLLVAKLSGRPYDTEIPFPASEQLISAPPLTGPETATIALISSGGIVPRGNPDRIEARRASKWSRFPIAALDDLSSGDFECVHGGFDNELVAADPDRVLPVDVMRVLEREGRIGRLYEFCYTTVGAGAPIERAQQFGREIGHELRDAGVQAAIFTAT